MSSLVSSDATPRVRRSKTTREFKRHNYRKALPLLLKDFEERCAYSLIHVLDQTSPMEVDHFNPKIGEPMRHRYGNLMPSIRHCNGKKSDSWPSSEELKCGIRFLDPTKEQDYGCHIFEDPQTHELRGSSPAGKYHVRMLDLNAPFLVLRRKERSELRAILSRPAQYRGSWGSLDHLEECTKQLAALRELAERMIPPIPAAPMNGGPGIKKP